MKEKKIEIKCSGTKNVRLESFKELQGNLKELSKVNYEKLKASILKVIRNFIPMQNLNV